MIRSQNGSFVAAGETLRYTLVEPHGKVAGRMLYLHGGGSGNRRSFGYLARALAERYISTFAFDFSGHGDSSGQLSESSLRLRVDQARAAAEFMGEDEPDIIMGNSMGGYVAAELLAFSRPRSLVLSCPALYVAEAFDVSFNRHFTDILRQSRDFGNARPLPFLRAFCGKVLLITAGQDQIIPASVIETYRRTIPLPLLDHLTLPDAPHQIHDWAIQDAARVRLLADKIACTIRPPSPRFSLPHGNAVGSTS